jgi:catechol 2,3-dioxygenase-like lactoylglutathione lyase family enzyme
MFNHISIGVRDIARSKAFYDSALEAIGYRRLSEGEDSLGYGKEEAVFFWVNLADSPVPNDPKSGLHFCFEAPDRDSVARFHAAALAAGGRDNGKPGTIARIISQPLSSIPTATGSKRCISERDRYGDCSNEPRHCRIRRRGMGGHSGHWSGAYAPGAGFCHGHKA